MIKQTMKETDSNADYVIGLIDGENYLPTKEGDYPITYGIPENAIGLDYFQNLQEGNLVIGYKTIMYRKDKEGVEWKDLPRFRCKNHGIFAVFKVKHGYEYNENWGYPHTICLSKPLILLKNRIEFKDLKTLVPKSEYVENCRRSVTKFSETEAKKICNKMIENNPDKAEEIKKIF